MYCICFDGPCLLFRMIRLFRAKLQSIFKTEKKPITIRAFFLINQYVCKPMPRSVLSMYK